MFINSIASQFIVSEQNLGYHLSKAALENFVKYYAVKYGDKQIRFNSISSYLSLSSSISSSPRLGVTSSSECIFSSSKSLAEAIAPNSGHFSLKFCLREGRFL